MTDLPEPLTPPDCDLQAFPFMPLHVARLRDSDLAAEEEPEACWYALLLWAASWHQIPAASLPNSEVVLMRLAGLGRDSKTWRKHKAGALRGFVECSDGRLYHPVVAEQAMEAWDGRVTFQSERSAAAERQARWREEQKRMCARLRELGVKPPEKASKATLTDLLRVHDPDWRSDGERDGERDDDDLDRNSASANTVTPPVTPVTPKKGTGTGTGTGTGIIIDDDGVAGADAREVPPWPAELIELTQTVCRAAGIRHADPGPITRHQAVVREWLAEGMDPGLDIEPGLRTGLARAATDGERINSLRFFDRDIRQTHARRRAGIEETPDGKRPRGNGRPSRADEIDDAARDLGFG